MRDAARVVEDTLSTPEAGRRLGVPTAEVYRLVDAGELEFVKDARGQVRVTVASVEAYEGRGGG